MSNTEKVKSFIAAWENRDIGTVCDAVAEDIFYHNIPMEPVNGREAVRQFAGPFLAGADKVVWELHHIAETSEGIVLTERTDHFHLKDGSKISVRVMGTFEFGADGLISKWRDYFDLAQFQSQAS